MRSTRDGTRRYGQHFLSDPAILSRIVEASGVQPGDAVLEIGPGRGDLTRALAAKSLRVLAVEIDRHLHRTLLEAQLPDNVEVRLGDAMALTGEDLTSALGARYRLVSNLPYEVTSATLKKFLSEIHPRPTTITLMVQKEVGERAAGREGMNRLALFCGYYASDVRVLFRVPKGAFSPPPKVESCVLQLVPRPVPLLPPLAEASLFRLSEAAFAENRRQLRNSLKPILGANVETRLQEAGIAPEARPEDIPLESWVHLALKM